MNHFSSVCKSRLKQQSNRVHANQISDLIPNEQPQPNSNLEQADSVNALYDDYVFAIKKSKLQPVILHVEGHATSFLTDSGSSTDIINQATYNEIHAKHNIKLTPTLTKLYPYRHSSALPLLGTVHLMVITKNRIDAVKLLVTKNNNRDNILGCETSIKLGLLWLDQNSSKQVNQLQSSADNGNNSDIVFEKYQEAFNGVGKLKNYEMKLHIDDQIPPVAQKILKTPFHIQKNQEKKIDELLSHDIIEKCDMPTGWVSLLVSVKNQTETQ